MESKIFEFICYRCIERRIDDYVESVSSCEIAENFDLKRNLVNKYIKHLQELGMIKSICKSAFDECNDRYVIVRGFCVTQKGRESETYRNTLYEFAEM